MPRMKLTAIAVKHLKAPESGRVEYFDLTLPGFALRITEKGSRSWVVFYRSGGRLRRMTIGSYPALGLADARMAAREAMQAAARGNDPAMERAAKRTASPDLFEGGVQLFIDKYASKNRSAKETERIFKVYVLPNWRARTLESITRRDVFEIVETVLRATTPVLLVPSPEPVPEDQTGQTGEDVEHQLRPHREMQEDLASRRLFLREEHASPC